MTRKYQIFVVSFAFCLLASLAGAHFSGGRTALDGYLFDLALDVRAALFSPPDSQQRSPVAVVAVDSRSLSEPELMTTPRALFAPYWAQLIEALGAAKVKAVAFDVLLSFSGNDFKDSYDKPFIRAVGENRERIVLGRSAKTLPTRPLQAALRFGENALGMLELTPEADGVYRIVPTAIESADGDLHPTLLAATLRKAGEISVPDEILLAPQEHLEAIPSYALIDILRCAETDPQQIERAFSGRIVFIGSVLPEEDRKLSSGRFLPSRTAPTTQASSECALELLGASAPRSRTVPGVYLHAWAAEAVMTGQITTTLPLAWSVAITTVVGGAGALVGILLMPWLALSIVVVGGFLLWLAEIALLEGLVWYPASPAIIALILSGVLVYSVRYLVAERRSRRVQHAFGRYLAPAVVEQLAESDSQLKLGGVEREISVMFVDLSGFTALSTRLTASELVELTNSYLAIIVAEIEVTGGYIDKFIGDAVMAMWGAPADDSDHAYSAVRASIAIAQRIEQKRKDAQSRGESGFGVKVGLHSGTAIVGNVGSERRYNYTCIGEMVNVASRLESLPGVYGCTVVIGPTTAKAVSNRINLRKLDRVSVKGRDEPLTIYQPIASNEDETPEQFNTVQKYHEALELFQSRNFEAACQLWDQLSVDDGPSAFMARRARDYIENPPPQDWAG